MPENLMTSIPAPNNFGPLAAVVLGTLDQLPPCWRPPGFLLALAGRLGRRGAWFNSLRVWHPAVLGLLRRGLAGFRLFPP